ncbi:hypothetical protein BVY04_01020 [bacterium M21]|nr:hypothetical protein BVY04_01020 [bacterium M21]
MKICHAFPFFSIKFAGGTCDLMYKIAKAQAKAGLQPVILTGTHQYDSELAASLEGVEFRVLDSKLDSAGFSIMPELKKTLENESPRFDAVHMHVFRTYQNVMLYKYCTRYNIPFVMDAHGAVPYYTRKKGLKKVFDMIWGRKMLRDATRIVAETEVGVLEYLNIDSKLKKNNVDILSPPFDTDEFQRLPKRGQFRKEWGIGDDEKVIMFLGRVHHIKGNDFLIKGFAEYANSNPKSRLVIVGPDDGHMEDCKQLAKDLGISDRVLFAGFLFADKKCSALVDADLVAQMSRSEQGAWAPLEGVLCGTPCIVTSHTGAGEDVKRLNAGFLVDFDDTKGLADQFHSIFSDYDSAKELTMKAKKHIEDKLSMNARIHEYTALYKTN